MCSEWKIMILETLWRIFLLKKTGQVEVESRVFSFLSVDEYCFRFYVMQEARR